MIQHSDISPNLDVLPGGPIPPNPTELVARDAFLLLSMLQPDILRRLYCMGQDMLPSPTGIPLAVPSVYKTIADRHGCTACKSVRVICLYLRAFLNFAQYYSKMFSQNIFI